MTREKMTIHKALAELKIMDARIKGAINNVTYCIANKHSNEKINGVPLDEYKKNIQSGYDKVNELIKRRKALKRAVVLSNAVTKVDINGVEYTVAEAIELRNHGIEYEKMLEKSMKNDYQRAMVTINNENGAGLEAIANRHVEAIYGNKENKVNIADMEKVKSDFIKANQYELIDPINVLDKLNDLESFINDFMSEVDATLSVSNALTVIEIEY